MGAPDLWLQPYPGPEQIFCLKIFLLLVLLATCFFLSIIGAFLIPIEISLDLDVSVVAIDYG